MMYIISKIIFYILSHKDLMNVTHTEEPPHNYHTISLELLPGVGFDGCVYKDEQIIDEDKNINIPYIHHVTACIDYRLFKNIKTIIDSFMRN